MLWFGGSEDSEGDWEEKGRRVREAKEEKQRWY